MVPLDTTNATSRDTNCLPRPLPPSSLRFAGLLGRLRASRNGQAANSLAIGVIACEDDQSTVRIASRLAGVAASETSGRTLLIDATGPDPRRSTRRTTETNEGFLNILYGNADPLECLQVAPQSGLFLLPWGEGSAALLRPSASIRFSTLLATYRNEFDAIVVALPPAIEATQGAALAAAVDGVILIIEAEHTSAATANRSRRLLERANVRVWGAILNNCREYLPAWLQPR